MFQLAYYSEELNQLFDDAGPLYYVELKVGVDVWADKAGWYEQKVMNIVTLLVESYVIVKG